MNRAQLELIVSEIARRFELDYFYVVGSAAVLASLPDATAGILTATRDVDVIPQPVERERQSRMMDQIDFVLGEASDFDIEHGFYAQAVDDSTVTYAPAGTGVVSREILLSHLQNVRCDDRLRELIHDRIVADFA